MDGGGPFVRMLFQMGAGTGERLAYAFSKRGR
ncbi:hypothetical protein Ga0123461_2118 [Mariprofundus aestuarium]|uniref:Uncharacterized protein n=1 Tax=Mariprofundus aestuarium TaxID=1921086 RepID=A0A2K8L6D5_MARES|nr:hypothetical protein Ga0123461_2118 [Mariprofundus aestuarium]